MRTIMIAAAASAMLLASGAAHASDNDVRENIKKYCKADVERLCSNVSLGGGRILKCLKSKPNELSVGCAKALKAMKDQRG
ncbi:cysteine rich repeat-containing protein [Xanthobacter sp. TB0139]|uniref:cysteine rich repeat-containing protein n=1 Tax=Xanthobacter sp. TB0139 TaxID=3459178 RepID=UPI0040395C8F